MQSRILTRFTVLVMFVFNCCLTFHVVANERDLAPILTPDGWGLLSDIEAYSKGLTPTRTSKHELTPRRGVIKTQLIKRPNSRVKVKFKDDLQIRLDVHNKPYSRTLQSAQSIADICESLGVTLAPTITNSQADIDALIRKAESVSRKQQPDIGGIYWITGDESSVDVAAEMFFTLEEVEWVLYKPVYSKMYKGAPKSESTPSPEVAKSKKAPQQYAPVQSKIEFYGACLHGNEQKCTENISETLCLATGGIFLGDQSICRTDQPQNNQRRNRNRSNFGPVGPCCMTNATCVDAQTQAQCDAANGWYAGDGIACAATPCSGVAGVVAGECCVLNGDGATAQGCVIVATEAQCVAIYNGVFLGINTDVPPTPCDASQTDCPAGVGPALETFSLCGEAGDFITYLSGDCYIDQTTVEQTSRFTFAAGCTDTIGVFAGPGTPPGADYAVLTGAVTGVSNVLLTSTCCETISTDVPNCAAGQTWSWNAICASYAQAYSVLGNNTCLRSPAALTLPTNNCFAPLGPTQDRPTVQPGINMASVGTANDGILISNPTGNGGVDTNCFAVINDPTGNGCADGDCVLNLSGDISGALPAINLTGIGDLNALAASIIVAGAGWTATVEGPGTTLDNVLNPTAITTVFQAPASYPQSFTTVPITATGCPNFNGAPTFPRANTTPDYAGLGLMTNMTTELIPWAGNLLNPPQPLAFPSDTATLSNDDFFHISQLLPWPMGGSTMQGGRATLPLSSNVAGGLGWYGGEGMDLFPTAPNGGGFGGAEVYLGSFGYGQFWADDGVGPIGPNGLRVSGAFGNNVKVAVLDWSAYVQGRTFTSPGPDNIPGTPDDVVVNLGGLHEEFLANGLATTALDANGNTVAAASTVTLEGTATGHDPVTLLFDENMQFGYSADHGTAVLGVIGANWSTTSPLPGAATFPPNLTIRQNGAAGVTPNIGVVGLAPDADLYFFPLATSTVADRQDQAWFNAAETLDAGDVICAAYRPVAISDNEPNLNYWPDTSAFMQLASSLGICTVIRAGDRGVDMASLTLPEGDQNVMVATAVTPGLPYKRLADGTRASNYTTTAADYASASASGFGLGVVTCGKGPGRSNYLGYNTISYAGATPYPSPASDPWIVNAQSYTNNFSGTGAAAAQLAGCVAQVQGFTKQVYGIPMGPQICRQLMAGGKYEGRNRDGTPILTPPPNGYAYLSEQSVDSSCDSIGTFTWDFCPVVVGNLTGNMLNPRGAMVNAILNPIFHTPSISNSFFIRGTYLFGSIYSLASIDGNLAAATPVRTKAHVPYNVPANVPGGFVRYLGNGLTTDLYLTGALESGLPMNNTLNVDVTLFSVQQDNMYIMLEMFDQRLGRWREAGAATMLAQGDTNANFTVDNASRFINASDDSYSMRIITLDLNSPNGGPTAVYPVAYDQILVTAGFIQH